MKTESDIDALYEIANEIVTLIRQKKVSRLEAIEILSGILNDIMSPIERVIIIKMFAGVKPPNDA